MREVDRNMNYQNNKGSDIYREGNRSEQTPKPHALVLQDRKRLEISGVADVLRFDDLSAELSTSLGDLIVEGDGLRIEVFDTERGAVTLTGEIRTIDYYEPRNARDKSDKKRGLFGKR